MEPKYPKLILPKPHLSWSQLICWITSKARYRKEYFENGDKLDTKFLRFGKGFATIVERLCEIMEKIPDRASAIEELARETAMTDNMKTVLMDLDIRGTSEFEIRCMVMHIVPCLSYLDKWYLEELGIREYKSGKIPWTKAKVQKHDQLVFYAVMLKWGLNVTASHADLDWIETKETQEESSDFWRQSGKILDVTGRVISFHREFDEREIERMENLIVKTAWEISDAYQDYLAEL